MEGLIFLLLMYWLFSKAKKTGKKGGKQKKLADRIIRQLERAVQPDPKESPAPVREMQAVPAFQPLAEGESSMAYTQDVHGCVSEHEEYMGSMNADTAEGEDACDVVLAHECPERMDPESVYAGEIGREPAVDLSAKGIYQGVVMSEILARPQRRAMRRF